MDAVATVTAVTKRWGSVTALDDVTVVLPPGVTGLLGANGAGKTTLLGLVLGFHHPDVGHLEVLGRDPTQFGPQLRARIGYAPEHDALPPDVRAQDLVRHIAELHGIPPREAVLRASESLRFVDLGEERFRAIGTMSTGQRQRVKIAQAIVHDPLLALFDEPTSGLDPLQREEMLELIRRIGHELDIHVLLSSHLMTEVERMCDDVVVLDGGRLVGTGSVEHLRGSGHALLVEVDAQATAFTARLEAAGLAARSVGPRQLTIDDVHDADYDCIRDVAADLGVGLRRLQLRTASLEELFFAGEPS